MKYEPDLFRPGPADKSPVQLGSYLSQAETAIKKASKTPSKGWLVVAWILGIIGVLAFLQGGFMYLPIAWFCFWYYYRGNAVYRKAISPLPYTPRTKP